MELRQLTLSISPEQYRDILMPAHLLPNDKGAKAWLSLTQEPGIAVEQRRINQRHLVTITGNGLATARLAEISELLRIFVTTLAARLTDPHSGATSNLPINAEFNVDGQVRFVSLDQQRVDGKMVVRELGKRFRELAGASNNQSLVVLRLDPGANAEVRGFCALTITPDTVAQKIIDLLVSEQA